MNNETTQDNDTQRSQRTYKTWADEYYQEHKKIPLPKRMHQVLPLNNVSEFQNTIPKRRENILVIGDVHGCYEELLELHEKAVSDFNHGVPFQYVILAGDLCNKGPHSLRVIRHVRLAERWLTVRGNHDDGALAAALGDAERLAKEKYQWVRDEAKQFADIMSDEDVLWMAELPYTLRIRGEVLGEREDTVIVHAGFIPGVELEHQSIETMTTVKEIDSDTIFNDNTGPASWASQWKGPFRVIFGHDAKRGLQHHNMATGLDTGACYGKQLTGLILPERKLVHVSSKRAYSQMK